MKMDKSIIIEAERILKNSNYDDVDESKLKQMIGQLLIDEMKSTIDNWDNVSIPSVLSYEGTLFEILEEILYKFIPYKFEFYNPDMIEFRNESWGDSLTFNIQNPKIETLNILDKNNNVHKKEIIDNRVTLETKLVCIDLEEKLDKFRRNKLTLKNFMNSIVKDIMEYLNCQISILRDSTSTINTTTEKLVKIGYDSCCIIIRKDTGLCLCIRLGVGMLGDKE